jgi:hypothetical protein
MLGAPLQEILVLREHGIDRLIEDVLGRLAEKVRVRIQGLVAFVIEARAMAHRRLPRGRGLIKGMTSS